MTDVLTADPDAFVYGDRLYVDTDRDEAPLGAGDFLMREWRMYSTTKTVNWTHHGALMTLPDFPCANRNAWAAEMVERDGRFYWYVPVQRASSSMSIGVAVGDSPLGPFHDALGGPLIDHTTPNHDSFDIDPTVLVDDDGQAHIYWGVVLLAARRQAQAQHGRARGPEPRGAALGPRAEGRIGKASRLNGSSEYVTLPAGVVSGSRVT